MENHKRPNNYNTKRKKAKWIDSGRFFRTHVREKKTQKYTQLYKAAHRISDTKKKESNEKWVNEMCDKILHLDNDDTLNKNHRTPTPIDNKGRIIIRKRRSDPNIGRIYRKILCG